MTETIKKNICIGIDLGTTYSCVAYYESDGRVNVIVNENGNRVTPSYVSFTNTERHIGDLAKKQSGQNPKNTVYDVKRLIGNKYSDPNVQKDLRHLSYNINPDENDKPLICVDYLGEQKSYHPEQISAMLLEHLKNLASKQIGYEITKAVITVPAYFNDAQRQATKDAGTIAGLDVIRIINEPTAAALAYGLNNKDGERKVLVYDFGGGTLDVSILIMDNGIFQVKSTNGDVHLGGEDFDNKLKDYCFMKFCAKYILTTKLQDSTELFNLLEIESYTNIQCIDSDKIKNAIQKTDDENINAYLTQLLDVVKLYKNDKLMRRLKTACEEAKKSLSNTLSTDVTYDNFYNGEDLNVTITKNTFESLCKTEFERCINPINEALKGAKFKPADIDDVVLIGGSTRVPKIRDMLNNIFPDKLRLNINPDEAVAHGASINGAIITDTGDDVTSNIVLIDVTPLTVGIETAGGVMEPMINRNTTIPTEITKVYSTNTDNQPSVTIKIFEGERTMTKHNNLLGKFELTDLPLMSKGKPRIDVTFSIDENGIMSIKAKETTTGVINQLTINNENNRLSSDDINKMIQEAEQCKENDKKIRDNIDAKYALESYIEKVKHLFTLDEIKQKIHDEHIKYIIDLINNTIKWLNENDNAEKHEYDKQQKELDEAVQHILKK